MKNNNDLKIVKEDPSVSQIMNPVVLSKNDIINMIVEDKKVEIEEKIEILLTEIDLCSNKTDKLKEVVIKQLDDIDIKELFKKTHKDLYKGFSKFENSEMMFYNVFCDHSALYSLPLMLMEKTYEMEMDRTMGGGRRPGMGFMFMFMGGGYYENDGFGDMMTIDDEINDMIFYAKKDFVKDLIDPYKTSEVENIHGFLSIEKEGEIISYSNFKIPIKDLKIKGVDDLIKNNKKCISLCQNRDDLNSALRSVSNNKDKIMVKITKEILSQTVDGRVMLENIESIKDKIDFGLSDNTQKLLK